MTSTVSLVSWVMGDFLAFGGAGMQEVQTTLGDAGDVEVQRLFGAFLPHGHLSLGAARNVHGLLGMANSIDVGHALFHSQLWLLVTVLIVRGLGVKAAKAASLG